MIVQYSNRLGSYDVARALQLLLLLVEEEDGRKVHGVVVAGTHTRMTRRGTTHIRRQLARRITAAT